MNRLATARLIIFVFAAAMAYSATNLIPNPTLANHPTGSNIPTSWNQGSWSSNNDLNAVFTYPVNCGAVSSTAANVTITSYGADGDAKWYSDSAPITPGAVYKFSDWYQGNVTNTITAWFVLADGSDSYSDIATLPQTSGACVQTTQTITAPANAKTITIFHYPNGAGSLTTANYSLTLNSGTTGTGFPAGLVSLTFDDGWLSHYNNAFPILKVPGMHGSFYIISNGMLNSNELIFPSSNNPFHATTTAKTVVWDQIYTDPTQHNFNFSDTYTASASSTVTINYQPSGGAATSKVVGTLSPGTNAKANLSFVLPTLAPSAPIKITHQVTTGTLAASNPVLTQSIGYMSTNQVLEMQAAGNEMANHTENHCDLGALQSNPSDTSSCALTPSGSTSASSEIGGARTDLLNAGLTPVDTLAYPYGGGAGNPTVEGLVAGAGHIAARSVDPGYNTKTVDKYHLLTQIVDINVTAQTIQGWIDYAAANKVWLILLFHQVETSLALLNKGKPNEETYGTTTAILQSTVNYLKSQQAAGKIVVDTVHNVMSQYMQ